MITFYQTKNINDYSILLDGLYEDFRDHFCHTILCWCEIMSENMQPNKKLGKYWEVWVIKSDDDIVGICGLYSLVANNTDNLWLGWFGILPGLRSKGYGAEALIFLKDIANSIGAKNIFSYVDEDGKSLDFYKRNGFDMIDRVGTYIDTNNLSISDFEDRNDYVIKCKL